MLNEAASGRHETNTNKVNYDIFLNVYSNILHNKNRQPIKGNEYKFGRIIYIILFKENDAGDYLLTCDFYGLVRGGGIHSGDNLILAIYKLSLC